MKSTNYYDTFIEVAEDCPVEAAEIPPLRAKNRTAVRMQYELLSEHPYEYTSDDVIFYVHMGKRNISEEDIANERKKFFSRGQPCLRSSALGKRYGWGVHSNSEGKVAIHAVESERYAELAEDGNLKHLKAMRSRK